MKTTKPRAATMREWVEMYAGWSAEDRARARGMLEGVEIEMNDPGLPPQAD